MLVEKVFEDKSAKAKEKSESRSDWSQLLEESKSLEKREDEEEIKKEPEEAREFAENEQTAPIKKEIKLDKGFKDELETEMKRDKIPDLHLLLMLVGLLFSTQVVDSVFFQYSCTTLHYAGYSNPDLLAFVQQRLPQSSNSFDSSLQCFPIDLHLVVNLAFIVIWVAFSSWYLVKHKKWEFAIDVTGFWIRVALCAVGKRLFSDQNLANLATVCLLIVV